MEKADKKQPQQRKERKLTEKQEKFCQFYIDTDGNASEAYRMAYDTSNMKPETIWREACRLLENHKVTTRIDEIRKERAAASTVSRSTAEQVLMDILTSDLSDIYIQDPLTGKIKMRSPSQLPKRARNALKKLKNNRGVVEYEFSSKIEAARLLGSWNGWDAPKDFNVNSSTGFGPILIGYDDDEE